MSMRMAARVLLALVALQEVSSAPVNIAIAQGQSLVIPLSGWQAGGVVKILDAGADVALTFELKQQGQLKYIARTSSYDGGISGAETWGGWPLGPISRAVTLQFTLGEISATGSKISVTVDDMQYPWFDFELPANKRGPFAGYELVNLVSSSTPTVVNRICPVPCAPITSRLPGECAVNGNNQHVKELGGFCNSVFSTTGGECCTGAPSTFTVSSLVEGSIATIVPKVNSDETYLDRACRSVDVKDTCGEFELQRNNQNDFNQKVFVLKKERDEAGLTTGRALVYLPLSKAKLMASPWMLVPTVAVSSSADFTGVPVLKVDHGTGQVTNSQTQVKFNHYITRLEKSGANLRQFTQARWQEFAASGESYKITWSDAPQLNVEESCSSSANWVDGQATPKGCRRYGGLDGDEPWCTKFGLRTNAWKMTVCGGGGTCAFSAFKANGQSALDACCECGGGTPVAM